MVVTICQSLTHPTDRRVATIDVELPLMPVPGDRLILPGTTARVELREMGVGGRYVNVWLENENRAYKGKATTIAKLTTKRREYGWTVLSEKS